MTYEPPAEKYESTPDSQAAYDAGHRAGWMHADREANSSTLDPGRLRRLSDVAELWAGDHYAEGSRRYLRAVEGFTDGAAAFTAAGDSD